MRGKWMPFGFQLHKVLYAVLMIHFLTDECLSINLEGLALLEFQSRVEVDPYGALGNWNARDSDPCNWTGVHCDDGKVVALQLRNLSLQGTLSSALADLRHLRSIVLYGNKFSGIIPKELGKLTMLELLDVRCNMLSCAIPGEIIEILSVEHILLCHKYQGTTTWLRNPDKESDSLQDQNLSRDAVDYSWLASRKIGRWQKPKKSNSFLLSLKGRIIQIFGISSLKHLPSNFEYEGFSKGNRNNDLATNFLQPYVSSNIHVQVFRRRLVEETKNLHAAPGNTDPVNPIVSVFPISSGSFPAIPKINPSSHLAPPPSPPSFSPNAEATPETSTDSTPNDHSSRKESAKWMYILIGAVAVLLIILGTCICLVCRAKGATAIGPWKTGISGQLQTAFVKGVPRLKGTELEVACEDFSNIIATFPELIIYKGILSNGVEIAVVSTTVTANDWTRDSEMLFRKKVETLSRINHKNFINLLGYCEEDKPFMRMMVLEYGSNGTLYEHLHVEEFERLNWKERVRIIMGTAYCLQYIHELSPPVQLQDLQSNSILVSEDFAARIMDLGVCKGVNATGKPNGADSDHSITPANDHASNVYSFGLLLLEIVSGKVPWLQEQSSILNSVQEYLHQNGGVGPLVDSSLKSHNEEELRVICEVIRDCTCVDPENRPSMSEVTSKLRQVIEISPEAAIPSFSPLWWAELEILTVEAS